MCVSSGTTIPGCEVRICSESGHDLPDGNVGEVWIRSRSLFDGYRNDPCKTAEVFKEGWYLSGDMGFLHNGECYVVGRKKDLIIVGGKNLYPEDIESVVGQVRGVSAGRVVAFGLEDVESGTERACVIAETDPDSAVEPAALRRSILDAVAQIDVTVSRVYLAPPRWLIKSSAGKPSRSANRERALSELPWQ